MEERRPYKANVVGSIPTPSTIPSPLFAGFLI